MSLYHDNEGLTSFKKIMNSIRRHILCFVYENFIYRYIFFRFSCTLLSLFIPKALIGAQNTCASCCFSINLATDNIIKGPGGGWCYSGNRRRKTGVVEVHEEIFFIMRSVKIAALVPVKPFV